MDKGPHPALPPSCCTAGARTPQALNSQNLNLHFAAQVLAFYERPFWRPSANVSEGVTFVLDPAAYTTQGRRSIDSV